MASKQIATRLPNGFNAGGDSSAKNVSVSGKFDLTGDDARIHLPQYTGDAGEDRQIRINPTTQIPEYYYGGRWRNFNAQTNVSYTAGSFKAADDGNVQRVLIHINAQGRTDKAKYVGTNAHSFTDCPFQFYGTPNSGFTYNSSTHTLSAVIQGTEVLSSTASAINFKKNVNATGSIAAAGGISGYSDPRTKEVLGELQNIAEVAKDLRVITYKSLVDGSTQIGYNADQVEEVCPLLLGATTEALELGDGTVIEDVKSVAYDRAGVMALKLAGDLSVKVDAIMKHLGVTLDDDKA